MDFLELFGRDFDPNSEAIVYRPRQSDPNVRIFQVAKKNQSGIASEELHRALLVIDDPRDPFNNIARSCYKFQQVQRLFADVLAALLSLLVRTSNIPLSEQTDGFLLDKIFQFSAPSFGQK